MTTAIIIDDMPQAIHGLQNDLNKFCPEIQIIGSAGSVVEGAKLVKKVNPDIVFLDIMMGDGTGFDFLEIIGEPFFKVIFTTASDEHALRAFKYAAVDYLLKPIDSDDLMEAVKRAIQQLSILSGQIPLLKAAYENQIPDRIALHTQDKVHIVEINNIVRCESDNNCTWFYFNNQKRLFVTKTLKGFEQILKDQGFIRCHQSHLINGNYIREFIKTDGGYLVLTDETKIPVAVRRKQQVMEWLVKLG